mmetsp:Transcript_75280/g.110340  ORF Transcript_75280/g.110340 Transcript_75280/m.110340 type:complete len:225 (-) Transcript_75280:1057-1731(-)
MFNDAIGTRSGLLAHLFANTSNHSSSSAPRAAIEREALPSTCHSTASPRNVLSNKRMSAQADDSRTGITTFSLHTGSDDAAAGVEPNKCSTSISILKKSSCPHTFSTWPSAFFWLSILAMITSAVRRPERWPIACCADDLSISAALREQRVLSASLRASASCRCTSSACLFAITASSCACAARRADASRGAVRRESKDTLPPTLGLMGRVTPMSQGGASSSSAM